MNKNNRVRKMEFKQLGDERGYLVAIEGSKDIPFEISRVFYIYGSKGNATRGQHANRESEFVIINVSGKSKLKIDDGSSKEIIELNKPQMGVYIPKMVWKEMYDFSQDSVILVLSSHKYNTNEYIRDYDEYISILNQNNGGMLNVDKFESIR